jgi:two-component system sensor histidine kinase EvgS
MPHLSGYQVARAIRAEEQASARSRCIILGYTANAQPEVRQKCLDAGMDDCLLKPISLRSLSQRLASVTPAIGTAAPAPLNRHFCLSGLASVVGDKPQDRRRLLTILQQSLHDDFAALMALDPQQQAQAIAEQAHKILSAARMLEARKLMEACERLEQANLSLQQLKLRRQVLARQMRRIEKALADQLG